MQKINAILCISEERPLVGLMSPPASLTPELLVKFGSDLALYGSGVVLPFRVEEVGTIEVLYEDPFGEDITYRILCACVAVGEAPLYVWFMPKELELCMGNVAHYRVLSEHCPRAYKV
jgi:hypothetical protein